MTMPDNQPSYTDQITAFMAHPAYYSAVNSDIHDIFTRHLADEDVDLNALDAAVQAFPAKLLEAHRQHVAKRVAMLKAEPWFDNFQGKRVRLAAIVLQDLTNVREEGLVIIGSNIDKAYAWNQERYARFVTNVTGRRTNLLEEHLLALKEFGVANDGRYSSIATLIESEPKTTDRLWIATLDKAIHAFWAWKNSKKFSFGSVAKKVHNLLEANAQTVEEPASADDKPVPTDVDKRPARKRTTRRRAADDQPTTDDGDADKATAEEHLQAV